MTGSRDKLVDVIMNVERADVRFHLTDRQALIRVSSQHGLDEIDTALAHDPRDAQLVVENLVDAIERIFLVHERV